MYPSISEIQSLIKRQRIDKALSQLISLSEHGEEPLYNQVQGLVSRYRRIKQKGKTPESIQQFQNQLRSFLNRMERNHTRSMRFISFLDKGGEAFKRQSWSEARNYFERAQKLHGPRFRMKEDALQRRIEMCKQGEELERLMREGEAAYTHREWRVAEERYTAALERWGKEFKYKKADYERMIAKSKKGLVFDSIVAKANEAQEKKQWGPAMSAYREAIEQYHEDFRPKEEVLKEALDECAMKAKMERRVMAMQGAEKKRAPSPTVWLSIFLVLFLVMSGVVVYQAYREQLPIAPRFPVVVANPHSEPQSAQIKPDNATTEAALPPAPRPEENPPVPVSNSLNEVRKKLPSFPETPPQGEKDSEKEESKTSPDSTTISSNVDDIPLRVAILPFCEPGEDENTITKNLYLDASFALSSLQQSHVTPISKNAVKGAIYRLSMKDAAFCEVEQALAVAQSLQVQEILVTHINTLPDQEIQVNCEVLDTESGQYTKSFTVSDNDIQRLRASLRTEIQKMFL